jgi:hypothetical protein
MVFSTTSSSTTTLAGLLRVIGGGTIGGEVNIAFSVGKSSPAKATPKLKSTKLNTVEMVCDFQFDIMSSNI